MNQILFTKKHIAISVSLGLVLVLVASGFWFMLLAPQKTQLLGIKKELTTVQAEVEKVSQNLVFLNGNPELFESEVVLNTPIIPNGMGIEEYFQELKKNTSTGALSIKNIQVENRLIFPEAGTSQKQLRGSKLGFDVISDTNEELVSFVQSLEQSNRFIKVETVTYRADSTPGEVGNQSYSASIVAEMYYLSLFETGKKSEPDSKK